MTEERAREILGEKRELWETPGMEVICTNGLPGRIVSGGYIDMQADGTATITGCVNLSADQFEAMAFWIRKHAP